MIGFRNISMMTGPYDGPFPADPEDGVLVAKQLGGGTGAPNGFWQWLPDNYSLTGIQTYPFILWLHGSGGNGNGTTDLGDVLSSDGGGVANRLSAGTWNGKQGSERFIVLMPQCPNSQQWPGGYYSNGGTSQITTFKNWAKSYYRIDTNRMYVMGHSMGGKGTYEALALDNASNEWAAAAPICTAGSTYQMGQGAGNKNRPLHCFYSNNDTLDSELSVYNGYLNTVDTAPHDVTDMANGHNPTRACSPTYYSPNIYEKLLTHTL